MRSPPLRFAPFRALVLDYYTTPPLRSTCEPKLVSQNLDSKLERKKLSQNLRFKTWGSKLERKNLSSKLERINLSPKNLSAKNLSRNLGSTFGGQNLKVKTKKRRLYRHNTNTKPNTGQHHSSFHLPLHSNAGLVFLFTLSCKNANFFLSLS